MSRIKRVLSSRATLTLGAWVAYVLAFIPLYRLVGQIVAALAILPVVVTGWLFGMRAGLLTGLLTFPLNMLLTALATGTAWEMMTPAGLFGTVLILLIGAVVGRLRDLSEQVKWELAERKRTEETLKDLVEKTERAKQEWESTADSLPELVCLVNGQGRIIRANRTVETWNLGQVVDVKGREVHELLHPGCTDSSCYLDSFWKQAWEEAVRGQTAQCEAYDEVLKRHVFVQVQPWKGAAIGSTVVTVHDITERKQAEEALRRAHDELGIRVEERTAELAQANRELEAEITERKAVEKALRKSEEKYRKQFEGTLDAIFVADAETGILIDCNRAACELVGREKSELVGQHQQILHPPEKIEGEFSRTFKQHLKEKVGQVLEAQVITKKGEIKEVAIKANLFELRGQKVLQGIFRDITERKRAEEEAQRRAAQATLIYEVGQRVSSKLELEALLSEVVTAVRDAFDYYGVMILLVDEEGKRLAMQSIAGGYADIFPRDLWLAIGEGMIGYAAAAGGETQISGDVSKDPHYVRKADEETKSELAVPIKSGEKVIGVLDIQSDEFDAFDETDVMLMETLADQVAIAIENAHLFEEIEERRLYLETVLGAAPDAIVTLDARHRIVEWNPGAERLFGYSREEVIGQDIDDLITSPEALEEAVGFTQTAMGGREVPPTEAVRYREDGSPVDVIVAGSPILVGDELIGTVVVYTDITERKRAEKERGRLLVAEREQRLLAETLAEVALALTSLTSHDAVLDEILRQVQRIVPHSTANIALWEDGTLRVAHWRGYEAFGGEELISSLVQTLDDLTVDLDVIQSRQSLVVPDTSQEPRWVVFPETAWIRSYLAVPICLYESVLGLLRLDSDTAGGFSVEDAIKLQPLANAATIALENARLFGEVQRLAITDGLTGMYNRRHFFELAERELNRARRFEQPVSAIMLDLDHFKQVNDTYGHAVGDQVLRVVAERCGESIRDIDILGRYGGEEFAVILPGTDLPGTQTMAERLRRYIADVPVPTDKGDLTVTISLGVASSAQDQDDEEDVAALLNRADAAMYAAKQAGRNRVVVIGR